MSIINPIPGLLRRRHGQASEADLNRRHSLFIPDPPIPLPLAERTPGRNSEQLPRRKGPSDFFDPSTSTSIQASPSSSSVVAESSPKSNLADERPPSPPIQHGSVRQRRFSMLKFRHASDSQLSTRARLQAEAAAAPPIPRREFHLPRLIDA